MALFSCVPKALFVLVPELVTPNVFSDPHGFYSKLHLALASARDSKLAGYFSKDILQALFLKAININVSISSHCLQYPSNVHYEGTLKQVLIQSQTHVCLQHQTNEILSQKWLEQDRLVIV